MRLVYKAYPALLWVLCLTFWAGGIFLSVKLERPWTLFLWPIPTGILSWFLAGLLTIRFPRICFVNEVEIDGLGYVHQPLDVLIPFWFVSMGLAIVAKIVDEHGGKIAVESEPAHGSVFRVFLPVDGGTPLTTQAVTPG